MVGRTLSPLQTFKLEAWCIELGPSPVLLAKPNSHCQSYYQSYGSDRIREGSF